MKTPELSNGLNRKTPLYDLQKAMGARMIQFSGWEMPVSYDDIISEHMAVRTHAGLFDVSHMGEILIDGKHALDDLQRLMTNDLSKLTDYRIMYSPMCYENGGVVDDVLIYRFAADKYLIVVNAGNVTNDVEWIEQNLNSRTHAENISDDYIQFSLQGPSSGDIMRKIAGCEWERLENMKYLSFAECNIEGMDVLISRTGYTGGDGFELYMDISKAKISDTAQKLWNIILDNGAEFGIKPAGLGARDTLRLEAALPLYGHELSPEITPFEAGLERFVKLDKVGGFIGRDALIKQNTEGVLRKIAGFKMVGRGVPRNGYEVVATEADVEAAGGVADAAVDVAAEREISTICKMSAGAAAGASVASEVAAGETAASAEDNRDLGFKTYGYVTSGSYLPFIKANMGLALIDAKLSKPGSKIYVKIRNSLVEAEIISTPFIKKDYRKGV